MEKSRGCVKNAEILSPELGDGMSKIMGCKTSPKIRKLDMHEF